MRNIKTMHFWNWFERHLQYYQNFETLTTMDKGYWLMELETHLAAYDRFLRPLLYFDEVGMKKRCNLVITADERVKSFRAADRLIGQAPRRAGWEFIALVPPRPMQTGIEEDLDVLDIDAGQLWFDVREQLTARKEFSVFVDTVHPLTAEVQAPIDFALFNLLGERIYALHVEQVRLVRLTDVLPENLAFLAPLDQLTDFVEARRLSGMVVGKNGRLGEG